METPGAAVCKQIAVRRCAWTNGAGASPPHPSNVDSAAAPRHQAGSQAVALLINVLDGRKPATVDQILPTGFVLRGSTAPPTSG
ncbi:MAG: hypothetical protein ORO03_03780 [Alphaproteobacteria bacterium]|nr:hypothetical protein [Alphaproteobacteria bacterium]